MTAGAIILCMDRYLLNFIVQLSMYEFSSPSFYNQPLQSGFWSTKSNKELLSERTNKISEFRDNAAEGRGLVDILKKLHNASKLDEKLSDKSKNREMDELIRKYPAFFDEESGNNRKEGIDQLKNYLTEEENACKSKYHNLKKEIDEIIKELDRRKEVEETIKTFFPIISIHYTILFRIFLAIFSFCLFFNFLDFDLQNFFSIPDIIIPTIITSTVYFLWKSYRIYSKMKNYYIICKRIYMYCKKNVLFFYKKIYSFYKKFK
jgi:hypothetical protein